MEQFGDISYIWAITLLLPNRESYNLFLIIKVGHLIVLQITLILHFIVLNKPQHCRLENEIEHKYRMD